MVTADDDGRLQLAFRHHFVEGQAEAVTIPIVYMKALRMAGTNVRGGFIHPQWFRQWFWQGHRWHFRWAFRVGSVSGNWSETGSENGTGTFSLAKDVRNVCPPWAWWASSCFVR